MTFKRTKKHFRKRSSKGQADLRQGWWPKLHHIQSGWRKGSPHDLRTISAHSPHLLRLYSAEKVRRTCGDCVVIGWSIYWWSGNGSGVIREWCREGQKISFLLKILEANLGVIKKSVNFTYILDRLSITATAESF